jgi:muramoyltetrapeptide carboxypeptidase
MQLTKPPAFKPGDRAYIISPSAGIMPYAPDRVVRAQKNLEELGYEVIIAPHADKNSGHISASITDRIADIHMAFRDPLCSLILCSIGGNHSNQLLQGLDYALIRDNPKVFCGYSDITVLHLALWAKAGLQTFYGPTFLNQFGEFPKPLSYTLNHFRQTIMQLEPDIDVTPSTSYTDEILDWFQGLDASRSRNLLANTGLEIWKAGTASGTAVPFTIPSINHIIGTDYMPIVQNPILFIDIPEGNSMNEGLSVGEFDAWFSDLKLNGLLQQSQAIVIGRAYKYDPAMVVKLKALVTERCSEFAIPIIYGLDFGHTDPMLCIPYAADTVIDTASSDCLKLTLN